LWDRSIIYPEVGIHLKKVRCGEKANKLAALEAEIECDILALKIHIWRSEAHYSMVKDDASGPQINGNWNCKRRWYGKRRCY
jgi:hypothetical protein